MDVRLLISCNRGNIFHASVIAVDVARGWHKLYRSKAAFVEDVGLLGLLTIMDQYDVLQSDFEAKDKAFMSITTIDAEALVEAGFIESTPAKPN